jgi:hypothetical protein
MKPKDAARIFDGLSEDVLVPVAQAMKSDALAPVLAAMNPSAAQKLTVRLASRLKLPDTAEQDTQGPLAANPSSPPPTATASQPAAAPPPQTASSSSSQPQLPAATADPAARHG